MCPSKIKCLSFYIADRSTVCCLCLFMCVRESLHMRLWQFYVLCWCAFRDMLCWRICVFAYVSSKKKRAQFDISHPTSGFLLLLIFHPRIIINDMMKSTERVVCSTHKETECVFTGSIWNDKNFTIKVSQIAPRVKCSIFLPFPFDLCSQRKCSLVDFMSRSQTSTPNESFPNILKKTLRLVRWTLATFHPQLWSRFW